MVKVDRRGLFLDLDGTLAQSLAVLRQAYELFLASVGKVGDDAEFDSLNGPTLVEIVSLLRSKHVLTQEPAVLLSRYQDLIDRAYLDALPTEGGLEWVRQARVLGWKVTVVTSNTRRRAESWLDHHGFRPFIDDLVSGEEVARGKPAPDLYLRALERSGCDAAISLAVEDSLHGAQAALSAGLKTLVCVHGRPGLTDWPAQACVISHFAELLPHLAA